MDDVTQYMVDSVRMGVGTCATMAALKPADRLTPARRKVLTKVDGMRLEYVSKAVVYAKTVRALPTREHKALIALLFGGYVRVVRERGPLPGAHSQGRVGAHETCHYVLRVDESGSALG